MRTRRVLHVGADCREQALPSHYRGWERVVFDINPRQGSELTGDVRNMGAIEDACYDAVYACRVLEFFHPWEQGPILREAVRVIRMGGFVEVRVPHVEEIFRKVLEGHALDAPLYHSADGPMTPQNLIHGRIGRTRNAASFMGHRSSFTPASLRREMRDAGLKIELLGPCSDQPFDLFAIGRKIDGDGVDPIDQVLEAVITGV